MAYGRLGQHLRVHARYQHVARDLHGQAAELPHARYIGHGLAGQAPPHHGLGALFHLVGGVVAHVAQQLFRALAGGGGRYEPRLQGGGLYPRVA